MWGNHNQYRGPRPLQYPPHKQWKQRSSNDGWSEDNKQIHTSYFQQNEQQHVPRQAYHNESNQFRSNTRYPVPPHNYSHPLEYNITSHNTPNDMKEQTVNVMVDSLLKSCRGDVHSSPAIAHPQSQAPPGPRPHLPESGTSESISTVQHGSPFNHPPPMIETLPMIPGEMSRSGLTQNNKDQPWRENYGGLHQNYQHLPNKNLNINNQLYKSKTVIKSDETMNQRQDDEKWILDWIVKKNIMMVKKTDSVKKQYRSLKVPEVLGLLQEVYSLIRQLQVQTVCLSDNISKNEVWEMEYKKTQQIKERLNKIQKDLNPDLISNLQRKLKIIKKKRMRAQRRKKETFENKEEAAHKREKKNDMIDEWRANILQKNRDIKMEKEVKKAADRTLAEVRKKIQEANSGLEVLQGLEKLRELRKDAAQRKGLHTSQDLDVAFEESVAEQKSLLEKQLTTYKNEKRTLEVMLETEQEENKEKESELHKQKLLVRQQEIEAETKNWIFGPKKPLRADNPLHSFKKFYSGAEQSLEMFLHTRHDWDIFLVQEQTPGGSKIPPGWVTPVEPSDHIWASALKINQT